MDTEKLLHIEHAIEQSKSLSDEGPYYHHAWWEAYKGASKGELGGTVIGAILGAAVGAIVGVAASILTGGAIGILPVALGFSAGGILYGVHKFSNVGAVSGAVSSIAHQGEVRMRAFEEGKFSELKQEVDELKAAIKGEPAPKPKGPGIKEIKEDLDDYRKTHYAKLQAPLKNKFIFWKIAMVGLAVGMAAGAILAASGATAVILAEVGLASHGSAAVTGGLTTMVASMMAVGALGASFGINRDIFRKLFDKTDLWFKGAFGGKQHDIMHQHQEKAGKKALENGNGHKKEERIRDGIGAPQYPDYPLSSTHYRDKVMAEKALLSFDHTRATPQ